MKSLIGIVVFLNSVAFGFSQTEKRVSAFVSAQVNKTVYDRTISNNSGGVGVGAMAQLNTNTWLRPFVEVNADMFAGTHELHLDRNEQPIHAKARPVGLYGGAIITPLSRLYLGIGAGTSIYNNKGHFGLRPSVHYALSKNHRWVVRASFTNVFQRDDQSNQSFGYFSFAMMLRVL